ncbi:hypothetical protein EVAR_77812_1 [Eumeta japonica]|uniref:Uncharacterized protein n=1 Tax=Eumeta variegata TaxID=151549 RepID=A0A4C1TC63_EUMVA|nr:hypothetical protein EVAR_77812_1 [Eumeta japonica]
MRKQGKTKCQRNRGKLQKQTASSRGGRVNRSGVEAHSTALSDDERSDDDSRADMLDEDDTRDLLRRLRRQPTLLTTVSSDQSSSRRRRRRSDSGAESADSDLETTYARELEQRPVKRLRPLLPIKTRDGVQLRHDSDDGMERDANRSPLLLPAHILLAHFLPAPICR